MMMAGRFFGLGCYLGFALSVMGCASSPHTDFYLLRATPPDIFEAVVRPVDRSLCIRRVRLPEYLDRPQMVVRESGHRLRLHEFQRWAEPLKENVARILAENLEARVARLGVAVRDGDCRKGVDYKLSVEFLRFETDLQGNAVLKARWAVTGRDEKALPDLHTTEYRLPTDDSGFESRVAAQSELLASLADAVADLIRQKRRLE